MNLIIFLTLWSIGTALPKVLLTDNNDLYTKSNILQISNYPPKRQIVANIPSELNRLPAHLEFIPKMRKFVEEIVNKGWEGFGKASLNSIELSEYNLVIPAGLIYLNLNLKNISAIGFGDYIPHESRLDIDTHIFHIDFEFPRLRITSDEYDLVGHVYTAVPLYGKGRAEFKIEGFRFGAELHLTEPDGNSSSVIKYIENARFTIRTMKSELSGVVGGGGVDDIVNALIEEVVLNYVNRFSGVISSLVSQALADNLIIN